jgi:hypothetical protein
MNSALKRCEPLRSKRLVAIGLAGNHDELVARTVFPRYVVFVRSIQLETRILQKVVVVPVARMSTGLVVNCSHPAAHVTGTISRS